MSSTGTPGAAGGAKKPASHEAAFYRGHGGEARGEGHAQLARQHAAVAEAAGVHPVQVHTELGLQQAPERAREAGVVRAGGPVAAARAAARALLAAREARNA
jgi:hypothetical protein